MCESAELVAYTIIRFRSGVGVDPGASSAFITLTTVRPARTHVRARLWRVCKQTFIRRVGHQELCHRVRTGFNEL